MLDLAPPSPEVLEQLLAAHSHRYPEKATLPVVGDRGEEVLLRLVLALPTGAVIAREGDRASSAWRDAVESMTGARADASAFSDRLALDCVVWPPPPLLATWRARWPAILGDIAYAALRKTGALRSMLVAGEGDPPPAIVEAQDREPRAVWRRLLPPGGVYDVAIAPPDAARHDIYEDAIRRREIDPVALVRQLAEAQTVACINGAPVPPAEVFARWPGIAVLVAAEARRLGGAAAAVRLGGW